MELVPSKPLPAPELPALKVYKRPKLIRFGYAAAIGLGMAAGTIAFTYFALAGAVAGPLFKFAIVYSIMAFCLTFGLYFYMDLSKPAVTLEEMWFRKRLDDARHCDTRVAQLKADHALLSAAAESLYASLGKDGFAKLKDADIINHAVELARKKTVD